MKAHLKKKNQMFISLHLRLITSVFKDEAPSLPCMTKKKTPDVEYSKYSGLEEPQLVKRDLIGR